MLPELEFVHLVDPTVEKWRETAKLCYRAVVMMGPHGAALTLVSLVMWGSLARVAFGWLGYEQCSPASRLVEVVTRRG